MAHKNKLTGEAVRKLVIEMSHRSRSGETGSALSISDVLAVLYRKVLRVNPNRPRDPKRDRFVLSKGHGAAALYATLALRGFFPLKSLLGHRVDKGIFHGHPSRSAAPGLEVSTGSLGHGLSIATGMAYALKNSDSRVYVLIGDGECNEGSVWEAALFCGRERLPNIVAIIDDNKYQGFAASRDINPFDLGRQWAAFGWDILKVDGHNPRALEAAFKKAKRAERPVAIIADTVSGKGIPAIEGTLGAHYYVPKSDDIPQT